ncbi:aminotransferase class V-fold PLP-dependent enzyme [Helicobacter cetorum]|uniref:aminotransferase class V-fold PLP-dependent enzyme n=1 Tax=Helicobacter cetorum TaxID=138563 RepID=UPI000CF05AED|nr:aminotransferase class V-fold PLP-dependent enzyme [Helicobacter cetorum]
MQAFFNKSFAPLLNSNEDLLEQVRSSIILKKGVRYFDFGASGLASSLVEKRIKSLLPYYANAHSIASKHAILMGVLLEECQERLKRSLNLNEDCYVLSAGYGASSAIKKFQEILGVCIPSKTKKNLEPYLKDIPLKHIVVGPYEHHSNEISWREGLCDVVRIPLNKHGLLDLENLEQHLKKTPNSLVSISAASNVTGLLTPLKEVSSLCKNYRATLALDLANFSAHANPKDCEYKAGFYAPHKLLGGVGGCGLLGIAKDLIDAQIAPSFSAGGVIKYANNNRHEFIDELPLREEFGTPGLLQFYKSTLAYQLRDECDLDFIKKRENILLRVLMQGLKDLPAINIYGNLTASRLGVVAFNIGGVSPYDLARVLSYEYAIETRAGCSCAGPYGHDLLNLNTQKSSDFTTKPGWLRVSLHFSHSVSDIDYLLESLKKAIKKLR